MWGKYLCNLIVWPWPHKLLTLPFMIRLGLCILCFSLCSSSYLLPSSPFHQSSILLLPMGLASWMFDKRGACSCFVGYLAVQAVNTTIMFKEMLWPLPVTLSFLGGVVIVFLTGSTVVSLRHLWDEAEEGRRQTALAYDQQRQLNQIKNQFILHVNHELRTPLTAAYGHLELIQFLIAQNEPPDHDEIQRMMNQAVRSLSDVCALVNSTLDTLEVGSITQALIREELVLATVVGEVFHESETLRQQAHRVHLDMPETLTLWTNRYCLRHILHHLLSNAFKYSPPETPVVISAHRSTEHNEQLCICVQDAGSGIPQEEVPLLFGQFVRLQRDIGGRVRGSGLGLSICKHLVEALSGYIWVESAGIAGLGSRFCFTLPFASE